MHLSACIELPQAYGFVIRRGEYHLIVAYELTAADSTCMSFHPLDADLFRQQGNTNCNFMCGLFSFMIRNLLRPMSRAPIERSTLVPSLLSFFRLFRSSWYLLLVRLSCSSIFVNRNDDACKAAKHLFILIIVDVAVNYIQLAQYMLSFLLVTQYSQTQTNDREKRVSERARAREKLIAITKHK